MALPVIGGNPSEERRLPSAAPRFPGGTRSGAGVLIGARPNQSDTRNANGDDLAIEELQLGGAGASLSSSRSEQEQP